MIHRMGFRFRLHGKVLPGKPDIVFKTKMKVVFVHGCFWHFHHSCCRPPKTRRDYWVPKLTQNAKRDKQVRMELRRRGWRSFVVWECELRHPAAVEKRLRKFLTT